MTDLSICGHLALDEIAEKHDKPPPPFHRQIRPLDYPLLRHRVARPIESVESELYDPHAVSTEPLLQRFPGYAVSIGFEVRKWSQ